MGITIDLQIILCFVLLLLTRTLEADSNVRCIKNERDALLKFKHSIADPSDKLKSWVGEDCCSWQGIICNNSNGHVTKLELRGTESRYSGVKECEDSCLGGQISHSLVNLTYLNYLDLSVNNFSEIGIPEFVGSFKVLEYLNFSQAKFVGNVPPYTGNVSRLKYLDLSYNSELIFDSLSFVSGFTSLEYLELSGLNLSMADDLLHSLNMLPSLMELHLSSCSLSLFPEFFRFNFTSLAVIDLSSNNFNSTISPLLFNITNVQHLDLSGNLLRGYLPSEVGNLEFLEVLRLQDNDLEGELPGTLMNGLCNLRELDLGKNSFSGEIRGIFDNSSDCVSASLKGLDLSNNNFRGVVPDSLGKFTSLEYLYLYRNSFEGRIPEAIGRLSKLRELSVYNNLFNGTIPASLGQLSELEILDFNNNKLEGIVSEAHFSKLDSLTRLSMYGNSLVFNIDSAWIAPFQLQSVYLSSCKLGPEFPQWLRGQTNNSLQLLDLYNTSISDGVPDWFQNISSNIQWLDMSHNQISKNLPKFGKPSTPVFGRLIHLNSNKFEGPFTSFPEDVEVLDISNNFLSGQIPQMIADMMPQLTFFSLSENNLSGDIPTSLCKLTELSYLDLSKNQLSGAIPECWQEMEFLNVLDLAYNELSGNIPVSLGSLHNLGSLHLERNNLEGNIPTSLGNLTNLLTLDLSENAFTGIFPSWINENLSSLAVLSLHSNLLKGEIPIELCGVASLRILNLANNMMAGTIPSCFGNFTSMIVEDPNFVDYWLSSFSFPVLFQMPGRYNAYQEHVLTYMKGRELEYNKTIQFLFSIDLSENRLFGNIPDEIVNLKLVQNLNLSGNQFTGNIISDIGNMKALESLDFSQNELSGSIPVSISSLNFLSYLNLSFNNLSGPIPHGNQLQTLDDKSIYIGNDGLCGFPLESCQKEVEILKPGEPGDKNDQDESEMHWFYYGSGVGFMTGFVVVCSSLYFKHSWRRAWFQFVDKIYNKLYVIVAVKMNQLYRKCRQT
ncbi:receptor-like protein EIX2 [Euphorbia lathyris]|uniref:receptor-like protein EIX2 n=1 Tax=Euphorbia lathyris TaxID=212925 RepID=UPI003314328F